MESSGNDHGIFCMCYAGTDLPESRRLFLCKYHVYRKFKEWYRSIVRLVQGEKTGAVRAGTLLFGIIFFFAIGAGIGGILSIRFGLHIIWVSCVFLLISFSLMFVETLKKK